MKVKLKTCYAGPRGNFQPKQIIEVDQREGAALVKGNYAEDVTPTTKPAKIEKAVKRPSENTAADRPNPKGERK